MWKNDPPSSTGWWWIWYKGQQWAVPTPHYFREVSEVERRGFQDHITHVSDGPGSPVSGWGEGWRCTPCTPPPPHWDAEDYTDPRVLLGLSLWAVDVAYHMTKEGEPAVARFAEVHKALADAIELLEECWNQWAYDVGEDAEDGERVYRGKYTGGLSTLEWLHDALCGLGTREPTLKSKLNP